jgi:glycerophosphoryl diester phosphodiesterase
MKRIIFTLCAVLMAAAALAQEKVNVEVIGHRGGRAEFEENTLSAFEGAYKKGVHSFETDIRLTADNELVIIHDANLKRVAGKDMNVEESTREQISKIVTEKGNHFPFGDQLAEFFSTRDIHYIEWEMKSNNYTQEQLDLYCDKLYKTVMPSKPEGAVYIFSSFDTRSIKTMQRLHPDAECMYIIGKGMSDELIKTVKSLGLKRVACNINGTTRKSMQNAHKAGLIVNLWPGVAVEDFQLAVSLGADISCSDIPAEVTNFTKKKMKWVSPHNPQIR